MSNMRIKCKKLRCENEFLKLTVAASRMIIAGKKERVRALEAENAALKDKIEQAERAMRPFWK